MRRIFKVGGAQAIAALAYGTKTIPQVDKIVGPGNAYVAAAKKLVFGQVDIDMIAGPSEDRCSLPITRQMFLLWRLIYWRKPNMMKWRHLFF